MMQTLVYISSLPMLTVSMSLYISILIDPCHILSHCFDKDLKLLIPSSPENVYQPPALYWVCTVHCTSQLCKNKYILNKIQAMFIETENINYW